MEYTQTARQFLPATLSITSWEAIEPYIQELIQRPWHNFSDFYKWLRDLNELELVMSEEGGWRFINFTRNTTDPDTQKAYTYYIEHIQPRLMEYRYELYQRYWASSWRTLLPYEDFETFDRQIQNYVELYRPENVAIETQTELLGQKYNQLMSQLTVEIEGKKLTLPQASLYLEVPERDRRQKAWEKIQHARLAHTYELHEILDELIALRTQMAKNAGFADYYDFRFRQLGRIDWNITLVHRFHSVTEKILKRLYERLLGYRKTQLSLDTLRPWDLTVDVCASQPLRPFTTGEELAQKTIQLFYHVDLRLGKMIEYLHQIGHLDLESRVGKAPGGYNYSLQESGLPFIFMNAAGSHSDLVTMIHEAGHAIHTLLSRDIPFMLQKEYPSEVAELASMSAELFTLRAWTIFYPEKEDWARAAFQQIQRVLNIFPWISTVDAFQEWLYKNPKHTHAERETTWVKIYQRFHGHKVDYRGYEEVLATLWQRQLHIYQVPLYYIEYGLAQLGALQVWYNYERDPKYALESYISALRLGYLRHVPVIYHAAGAQFFFTEDMLQEIFRFIIGRLKEIRDILRHPGAHSVRAAQ
ncbi:MAG: M3 family oligoendopeptidase [Bacteroidia bacterium]